MTNLRPRLGKMSRIFQVWPQFREHWSKRDSVAIDTLGLWAFYPDGSLFPVYFTPFQFREFGIDATTAMGGQSYQ